MIVICALIALAQAPHTEGIKGIAVHYGPMEGLIKRKLCKVVLSYYVEGSTVYQGLGARSFLGNASKAEAEIQKNMTPKSGWKFLGSARVLSRGPRRTLRRYVHPNPAGREWTIFGTPDGSKYCLVSYHCPLPSREAKVFRARFGNKYRVNNLMRITLK